MENFRFINMEIDERWFDFYMKNRAENVRLAICTEDELVIGMVNLLNIDKINQNAEFSIQIGEKTSVDKKEKLPSTAKAKVKTKDKVKNATQSILAQEFFHKP